MISDCVKPAWSFSDALDRSVLLPSHERHCISLIPMETGETVAAGADIGNGQHMASARLSWLDVVVMSLIAVALWCNLSMMGAPVSEPFVNTSDGILTPIVPVGSSAAGLAH